jgi:hypothetical protein
MKNYFEFVKELSLKNNKPFKEVLLDTNTKLMWNQVRPKKVRVKKTVTKLQKTPGVKIDLSRAQIVPAEIKQEPDRMLDYYNQRWSNFVNSINVENFRDIYTIDKRPKELKPYNLDSIRYLLMDKSKVIEDSPLSYELSSYVFNVRVNFPGKRNIKIYRNDLTNLSNQLKDINMQNQTSEFMHDFELFREGENSLYDQVYLFHDIFKTLTRKPNVIYLNDMMYPKRVLYSLIFLYGSYLKLFANNRDKYLIVVSNNDLGDNVAGFYKNLDVGYFNSGDFEFGIPDATPEFNFGKIANYMAGTSSEIPVASMSGKTSPIISSSTSPIVAMAIQQGVKDILGKPFPYFNQGTVFNTQDKEFIQRIYFIRDKTILLNDPNLKTDDLPNVGDFIYFDEGYLSQVIESNKKGKIFKVAKFYTDNYGVKKVINFTLRVARNVPSFQTIRFIERGNARGNTEYTSLRNMAINDSLTYKTVYDNYKQFFTDQVDDSNYRGNVGGKLDFDSSPNTFKRTNKPSLTAEDFKIAMQTAKDEQAKESEALKEQVQEPSGKEETVLQDEENELEGGSNLTEDDLIAWLSVFNLKGVDVISDVGNGQKAYLLSF